MALVLYCTECSEGYRYQGGAFPANCPRCLKATTWKGATIEDDPTVAYVLSPNDRRLLRSFRIEPDDAEPTSS